MENKMTDNEIIKAFTETYEQYNAIGDFRTTVYKEVLDLINRQKVEIERLKNDRLIHIQLNDKTTDEITRILSTRGCVIYPNDYGAVELIPSAEEIKAEAIKQFYDELTELAVICGSGVDEVWTLHAEKVRRIIKKLLGEE